MQAFRLLVGEVEENGCGLLNMKEVESVGDGGCWQLLAEVLAVLGSTVLDGETFDGAMFCPERDGLTIPSMCTIESRSIFMYSPFAGDNGGLGGLGGSRPFCCRPFSFLSFLSAGGGDGTKGFMKVSVEAEAQEESEVIWDDEPVSEESLPRLRFLRMSVNFLILPLRRSLKLPCSRKEKSESG